MRHIVLVDGNPLMWRAVHSKGEQNVTEYILRYFFDITEKFKGFEVLAFWDEGKSRWRSEYYPEYKAQRAEQKKDINLVELKKQKDDAIKYLEYFGVRSLLIPGIEADDLIAVMSEYFSKVWQFSQVVIASRDRDLWQLASDSVHLFDPYTNEMDNVQSITEKFSVGPEQVPEVKALSGDTADNIKGIYRVGDKTAVQFLSEYGGIEGLMSAENAKEMKKKKATERILNDSEDMELSYQLVMLPKLYNISYYFTEEELEALKACCTRTLRKDMLLARTEADLLSLPTSFSMNGFNGLDNEMAYFVKEWLSPYRVSSGISMKNLDKSIGTCRRCFKCFEKDTRDLPEGKFTADFMVVSRTGESDRSLMEKIFEGLEISTDRIWWTSVSKCGGKKPLTYGQMKCCSDFLRAEIDLIKPKMLFALGIEAMTVLTDLRGKASENSGKILEGSEGMIGKIDNYISVLTDPDLALRSDQRRVDWVFGAQKVMEFFRKKREGER